MSTFSDFGLLPSLQKTLKDKKMTKPTEIQSMVIPMMIGGTSVVGISETGSGKTLAFALPLLQMLKTLESNGEPVEANSAPRAVIMVPTRDLGEQVSKVFKTLTHDTRLRVRPALGGMEFEQVRRNVSGPFEILLATPGRMVQLIEKDLIDLTDVRYLVFDEADQMLDQGFLPDSNFIVDTCPRQLQLALFSATVSPAVQELMNTLFANAEIVRSAGSGKTVASLVTKNVNVVDGKRWPSLERILNQRTEGGTLVFTNTREQCDKLAAELAEKGFPCGIYRGEMDKNKRRQSLKEFREGKFDLLIATDLAGRGLDLEHVGRVINYHLPQQMENYLHRVGRTARAGRPGLVINLVTERDERLITKLGGTPPTRSLSGLSTRPAKGSGTSTKAASTSAKKPFSPKHGGSKPMSARATEKPTGKTFASKTSAPTTKVTASKSPAARPASAKPTRGKPASSRPTGSGRPSSSRGAKKRF
jgi:ATP-dependent RNA helicase RhlE